MKVSPSSKIVFVCVSNRPYVRLSVYPSVCIFVCLSVCLSLTLSSFSLQVPPPESILRCTFEASDPLTRYRWWVRFMYTYISVCVCVLGGGIKKEVGQQQVVSVCVCVFSLLFHPATKQQHRFFLSLIEVINSCFIYTKVMCVHR